MKDVTINGVSYLPASALAKEFRYTTDYIGQLCRAKKVDAQFIGRSWYVNPLSLTSHKKAKVTKSATKPEAVEEVSEIKLSRIDVPPVVTKTVARTFESADQNFAKRIDWKPLKYEVDEGELLPLVTRTQPAVRLAVGLADATVVPIKTSSESINLVPDALPHISLKGSIAVTSLDEGYELPTTIEKPEVLDVPLSPDEIKMINFAPLRQPVPSRPEAHTATEHSTTVATRPVLVANPRRTKPALAITSPVPVTTETSELIVTPYQPLEITLTTLSLLLVGCLGLLVFGESSVEATGTSYHFGIDFSATSLTALVSYFSY